MRRSHTRRTCDQARYRRIDSGATVDAARTSSWRADERLAITPAQLAAAQDREMPI